MRLLHDSRMTFTQSPIFCFAEKRRPHAALDFTEILSPSPVTNPAHSLNLLIPRHLSQSDPPSGTHVPTFYCYTSTGGNSQ
jgi:hypothetical protein